MCYLQTREVFNQHRICKETPGCIQSLKIKPMCSTLMMIYWRKKLKKKKYITLIYRHIYIYSFYKVYKLKYNYKNLFYFQEEDISKSDIFCRMCDLSLHLSHNFIRIDLQHVIDYKDYSLNLFLLKSLAFSVLTKTNKLSFWFMDEWVIAVTS